MASRTEKLKTFGAFYKSMNLTDKYVKESDSVEEKKGKVVLGDDAFAICEFLEKLEKKFDAIRRASLNG